MTNKENQPIDSVMVFFQQSNELNTFTDVSGFFKVDYSSYDVTGWKLTFYKEGYKEKSIPFKKLSELMVVTLDPSVKKDEKIVYEDEIVELDGGIIYSSFAIDSMGKINSVLDNIVLKHSSNYPYVSSVYNLKGYHSLSEKPNEEREDTLLYLKDPLHMELSAYNDPEIHLNSKIAIQPESTLFVKNQNYNVPKDSPFFFNEQISWIDFLNKEVLKKRKLYNYKIIYQDDERIEISFDIKKVQKNSWSGIMTIRKEDFAVTKIEANLEFNRKNSYTIVSKSQTKNSTSLIYFEGAKIILDFSKSDNGLYHVKNLDSSYRIIHIGVDPLHTPQFLVQTKFEFGQDVLPEECKVLPLNELLFLAFHKNYSYNN